MPGQLRPDASCPSCGRQIIFVARTWHVGKDPRGRDQKCEMEFAHEGDIEQWQACFLTVPWGVAEAWGRDSEVNSHG